VGHQESRAPERDRPRAPRAPFKPERFQIEMMDVMLDPNVHEVVVMKKHSGGLTATRILNNIVGYFIDADPKPIMLCSQTIDNARDYGKKRIRR